MEVYRSNDIVNKIYIKHQSSALYRLFVAEPLINAFATHFLKVLSLYIHCICGARIWEVVDCPKSTDFIGHYDDKITLR